MPFTLTVTADTADELFAALAQLAPKSIQPARDPNAVLQSAGTPRVEPAADPNAVFEKPAKPGRKPKVYDQPVDGPAETPAAPAVKKAPACELETAEELKAYCMDFFKRNPNKDPDITNDVLAEFKYTRLKDVKPEDIADFKVAFDAAVGA